MTIQEKIEKIREMVIMKNNPECKSYEEALEAELDYDDCLVCSPHRRNFYGTYLWVGRYKDYDYDFDDEDYPCEILGRPITLERLLIALNNIDDYSYYSFGTGNIYCSEEDWSCVWQPNKILEDQSEETIEKIYNILF